MNVPEQPTRWARIAVDTGLAIVFAVVIAATAVAILVSWGGSYWLLDAVAGVLACGLALLRRRHPARMAYAGAGVAVVSAVVAAFAQLPQEPGPPTILALGVLVASAVRRSPVRQAVPVAAVGSGVVVVSWAFGLSSATVAPPVPVLSAVGFLAALAAGLLLRHVDGRREAMAEQVRQDERLALARELHDVVAHHVTGIVVQAQAAQIVARKHPERLDDSLAGITTAGSDALAAMRRVVGVLRDTSDGAPSAPGPEGLRDLVERFAGHGPPVDLRLPGHQLSWPPEVTSTVHRIVQECLTNVARHAPQARAVTVDVTDDGKEVAVAVIDDATTTTIREHRRTGYGLVGMRERVEALGGTFSAGPRTRSGQRGWSVLAALPLPGREPR